MKYRFEGVPYESRLYGLRLSGYIADGALRVRVIYDCSGIEETSLGWSYEDHDHVLVWADSEGVGVKVRGSITYYPYKALPRVCALLRVTKGRKLRPERLFELVFQDIFAAETFDPLMLEYVS